MGTGWSRRPAQKGYRTLTSEIYAKVKHDIITCKLQPGEMVHQSALMQLYETGKTPLREALKLLTQEGLIQSLPSRGYLVAPITVEDVRELFDVRRILEAAAVEKAAEVATEKQLEQLESLVGGMHLLNSGKARVRWYTENAEFHVAVAEISGNSRLVWMLRTTLEDLYRASIMDLYRAGSRPDTAALVGTHRKLVKALRKHDAKVARELSMEALMLAQQSIQVSLYEWAEDSQTRQTSQRAGEESAEGGAE